MREFFKYDFVIMPFFSDTTSDKRALIVVLRVSTSSVDLYDRDREEDSKCLLPNVLDHDISDAVIHMMSLASKISDIEFNEDQIDGAVERVCATNDENMLVAVCHIAECLTFNRPVDLEAINIA
jgi:hypothetical protein